MNCPVDQILYTHRDRIPVKWLPPTITDNVDVPYPANVSLNWGSKLTAGKHNVR